jgi:translation initiation factor 4A
MLDSKTYDQQKSNENPKSTQDPSKWEIELDQIPAIPSFDKMDLHPDLLRGLYGYGFDAPSVIQQKAILPFIKGKDMIAQAQSGTGKTGAFSIGLLQTIDPESPHVQALVLAPARELAKQIAVVIKALSEYMKIGVAICTGGSSVYDNIKQLKEGGNQIIVGTPGRVEDLLKKNLLKSDYVKCLVLDEADEMLSRGFKESMNEILQKVPGDVQIALFSATMPADIIELSKQFLRDPVKILVKNEELTLDGIKQYFLAMDSESDKFANLLELYQKLEIQQCMIYCNTKKRVEELSTKMKAAGFVVSHMHGEMDQSERDLVMREFRSGASRVLISTDLLARGIDIQQISIVINYDLQKQKEQYIHRIGRAGRFGRKGVAINFVTPNDYKQMIEIEKFYNTQINEIPVDLAELYDD